MDDDINIVVMIDDEEKVMMLTTVNPEDFDATADVILEKIKELGIDNMKVSMN